MRVRPIRPVDIPEEKEKLLPNEVISAWNEVIAKNYCRGSSQFTKDEIIEKIMVNIHGKDYEDDTGDLRKEVYKEGYLDIEIIYEKLGWEIEYDKPGYNESYKANFTFTKK